MWIDRTATAPAGCTTSEHASCGTKSKERLASILDRWVLPSELLRFEGPRKKKGVQTWCGLPAVVPGGGMSVIAEAGLARGGGAAAGEGVVASRREAAHVCTTAETASRAAASPHPCERAAGSGVSLPVLFVAHSGYFQGTSYGGATRASLALLRHTRRLCARMDVCALVQRPTPEGLVWRLDGGGGYADGGGRSASAALGVLQWEPGVEVLVGEEGALSRAVADHHYDAVIALSLEPELLRFALKLDGARRYVLAHNYYLPPFGPFRRAEPCADHVELLARMDEIWSPCKHHREYLLRSTTLYLPPFIYHPDLPP